MSIFFWIWLVVIAACIYKIRIPYHARRIYLAEKLPGPIALPILGNAHLFLNKPLTEVFSTCISWLPTYGNLLRVWIGNSLYVIIGHPIEAEAVLNNSSFLNKADFYDFLHGWLGSGLLTSTAQKWYPRRKIITPAFHFKILEHYIEVFDRQSDVLINILAKFEPTDCVNIEKFVGLFTLDVMCETAMGTRINAQINEDQEYVKNVKKLTSLISARIFSFLLRHNFFYRFSSMRRQTDKCLLMLHSFTDGLIQSRRHELLKEQPLTSEEYLDADAEMGSKRKYNFVDILLHAQVDGRPLTNGEIREEVDTFMFEGHDTTTSAITFAMYNMAKYPDEQRKCVDEIRAIIGDDRSTPLTSRLLNSLPYMDLVIKETLRMYPSVPTVGRKIEKEVTINGRSYPPDTNAMIAIMNMGRSPLLHEDPMTFRPERFLESYYYTGKGKAFAYIPFSGGSRNCIGQKFAELELKSVLTKILRFYELSLHPDSVPEPVLVNELILKTQFPLQFHLKAREMW